MTMLKDILTGGEAARRKSFSKNNSGAADSAAQTGPQTPPTPSVGRFLSVPGSGSERRHSSSSDPVMAVEEGRMPETQGSQWWSSL